MVELHGLFMGPKTDCDKLLVSSGMLGVPGITYRYYSESDYLTAASIIAGMTEGCPCSAWLSGKPVHNATVTVRLQGHA